MKKQITLKDNNYCLPYIEKDKFLNYIHTTKTALKELLLGINNLPSKKNTGFNFVKIENTSNTIFFMNSKTKRYE